MLLAELVGGALCRDDELGSEEDLGRGFELIQFDTGALEDFHRCTDLALAHADSLKNCCVKFWASLALAVDRDADQHGHAEQTDSELAGAELAHHFDDVVVGGDADLVREGVDLVLDGIQGNSWVRAFLLASV